MLVPSGALTQLPFQVLVTVPPAGEGAPAAWLIRDHALTVLPAVSSLKALRRVARPSAATKPLIGFGNPLLDGHDPADAKLARDNQSCAALSKTELAARQPARRCANSDAGRIGRCVALAQSSAASRDGR